MANKLVDKLFGSLMASPMSKQSMMPQSPFLAPSASKLGAQVQAVRVQDKLKMYGIGSSPLEKLALTAISVNNRARGDLGFDPLGLKPTDPKKLKDMQAKELNNGRLAMIAAAGMIAQEVATDSKLF